MLSINQSNNNLSFIERLNQRAEQQSEKLASGKRINKAADDAAGLQIANRLTSQINGNQQLSFNAQDQVNLNTVKTGALSAITEGLERANVLSVQSGNPLYDSSAIQDELNQITEEINTVASNVLGQENFISGLDASDPQATQTAIQDTAEIVNTSASELGASSNSLASQVSSYETSVVNVSASRSRIEDTDFAAQTSEQQQTEILLQAAIINKKNEEERKGLLFNKLV
ncbi:flagellin [Colwellia sp. D2M02]|uniref:flagellin n=1 Tax=Colwellia sp. D2M02 TaxID=2841562 RepID=UPI001C092AEA|nr:flagellin [Colwellia sp. D2M02]MBU2893284.1 flagellin [Colwellia sp. D2M02]